MARKKVIEEVIPEVVEEVKEGTTEEVVEEKPKATRKRKVKVEEPIVESIVESPIAEEPVQDIIETPVIEEITTPVVEEVATPVAEEKPKKAKKAKVAKAEVPTSIVEEVKSENSVTITDDVPYKARVTATIIHSRKGPGLGFHTVRDLYKGAIVVVQEVDGNWGRISKETWININYIEKI